MGCEPSGRLVASTALLRPSRLITASLRAFRLQVWGKERKGRGRLDWWPEGEVPVKEFGIDDPIAINQTPPQISDMLFVSPGPTAERGCRVLEGGRYVGV